MLLFEEKKITPLNKENFQNQQKLLYIFTK